MLRDTHVDYVFDIADITVYDRASFIINAAVLPGAIPSGFRDAQLTV